jgi:catechol 2,3-dioxygenase-like lactoylglutathione lyase family enzyme
MTTLPEKGARNMEIRGLDHVVVVVIDIETARTSYRRVFGDGAVGPIIKAQAYLRCLVDLGGQRIELCQPLPAEEPGETQAAAAFGRTLESRGEGLHSIAIQVEDLEAAAEELDAAGIPVIRSAFSKSFFVHPRVLNGLIVQLMETDHPGGTAGGDKKSLVGDP